MYNTFERTIVNTICYRTFDNEEYLFCICYYPFDKAKEKVKELNEKKPEKFMNEKIN